MNAALIPLSAAHLRALIDSDETGDAPFVSTAGELRALVEERDRAQRIACARAYLVVTSSRRQSGRVDSILEMAHSDAIATDGSPIGIVRAILAAKVTP